ncbi:membrane hypothetical protein [Methylocella tundrae]|uniref:Uncharacterized protein n=1 Tax=Methylocella tundrae TaxID=227605 RepID=A0A4U8Z931_METTU|nr:hypothetical protein [Methylocella tundrae]WPP02661.1 hypothetical protein SIN04_00655 [Methylocella tundrae]VFU17728.1 membrane protein of unknown function [Methylocella tundrae]VTZ27251.1 membrane hypothetical protein [Methylocella tundrae]VTZ48845.1 membrane hypothetical protein [Methylocella tundrae]
MAEVPAAANVSLPKRTGVALLTAVTCACVAFYANETNLAIIGAIVGGAAAGIGSILYGPTRLYKDFSRADIAPFILATSVGIAFGPTFAKAGEFPPNAVGAASTAAVLAGASEIVKGSGFKAGYEALFATMIITCSSIFLSVAIGQYIAFPSLVGAVIGLFVIIVAPSPWGAFFGIASGEAVRSGLDAGIAWLHLG